MKNDAKVLRGSIGGGRRRARTKRRQLRDSETAQRIAAKCDAMTLDCLLLLQSAGLEATAALKALAGTGQAVVDISDQVEKILHVGFQEAIGMLPPMPISRLDFDALPVLPEKDDGWVGLGRKALRSWWIIVRANSNGTGVFYRPDILDGAAPLH